MRYDNLLFMKLMWDLILKLIFYSHFILSHYTKKIILLF